MIYYNKRLHPDYNLDKENFNFLILEGGLLCLFKNIVELLSWRESNLYKQISKRLYNDGLNILNNWNEYIRDAEENGCASYFSGEGRAKRRIRQYKVYEYVFGHGFKHFIETTMKYGHNINGTQYIIATYKDGVYYEVKEPFTETSYLEFEVKERMI